MTEQETKTYIITDAGLTLSQAKLALGVSDQTFFRYVIPLLQTDLPTGKRDKIPGITIKEIHEIIEDLRRDRTLYNRKLPATILFELS